MPSATITTNPIVTVYVVEVCNPFLLVDGKKHWGTCCETADKSRADAFKTAGNRATQYKISTKLFRKSVWDAKVAARGY